MTRTRRRDLILLLGTAFVLALVVVVPLTLALISADAVTDEIGVGCGTGELSAAALSSLQQGLVGKKTLPAPEPTGETAYPTARETFDAGALPAALSGTGQAAPDEIPVPVTGPGPDGHPLLS